MSKKTLIITFAALFACFSVPSMAQYCPPEQKPVVETLERWEDLKFGVIMHWGLYSIPGIVESWTLCAEDEPWIKRDSSMSYDDYKKWYWGLASEFDAEDFNPRQWARVFRKAGMKYMVFTTKHHDGYCLYDSRQTDFTVMNSPFGRDAAREVWEAFRQEGFMLGAYFSKPDWHSQYYWWDYFATPNRNVNYSIDKHPRRWERFKEYTHAQIMEIVSNYGHLDILWLDGGQVCPPRQDIDMDSIVADVRRVQPGILVVDRTVGGKNENYMTPENTIPSCQLPYPWESCITLTDNWGWVPDPVFKSSRTVIAMLAEIVAKGGSLLLGVGPTPEGVIQGQAIECLSEVGKWLEANGDAIYATRRAELYNDGDVYFTMDKDGVTCYAVYVLRDGKSLPGEISWSGNVPSGQMRILSSGKKVSYSVDSQKVTVRMPKALPEESLVLKFTLK